LYSINNTIITATHSHSGAGGFQQYLLYSLTSLGFVPQMYNIVVEAIKQVRDLQQEEKQQQCSRGSHRRVVDCAAPAARAWIITAAASAAGLSTFQGHVTMPGPHNGHDNMYYNHACKSQPCGIS
jgi:hypothetical protein